jgi:CIC family chloride channel protein
MLKKLIQTISGFFIRQIEKAKMTEHTFMIMIALFIGVFAGLGAVAIRQMILSITSFSFPGGGNLLDNVKSLPWYIIVFTPCIGGLIVGPIIYFFAREAKGHGVPEVMEAILMKGGSIRPRVAAVKAITSAITIGTGGSVGREGPIVQIGSTIGSTIGYFLKVSPTRMKTFVGCGAAAGIAAAFNAPIAGALFAVEILLGDFAFSHFSPIVISSVMATVISHQFEGNFAAFKVPSYQLVSPFELGFYAILGLVCAVISVLFIKVLYYSEDFFDEKLKIKEYLKPALGGLLVGLIALKIPEVLGLGYDSVNNALNGNMIWSLAIALVFIKIIATSLTLGSGGSGGIFTPSLFLGAMAGTAFGFIVHTFFPEMTASPGAYALVAMSGLVAGTTHAPITAIIIVFELTNDYRIILPLMITCIISTIVSTILSRESIYSLKLVKRNIHLKNGIEINIMNSLFAKDIYKHDTKALIETTNFYDLVNSIISSKDSCFPILNKKGRLTGIITIDDIKEYLFDKDTLKDIVIAADITNYDIPRIIPDDNCQFVLNKMSMYNIDGLPVVDKKHNDKLLGMIWRRDIIDAYNEEIKRADISSTFASMITMKKTDQSVHFMEGYAITEISVPEIFIGKSLKSMNVRSRFGVNIILIRSGSGRKSKVKVIPEPEYIFSPDDSLVIAGEIGKINLIKNRT